MSEIYNNNYYLVVSGPTWNDAESNAINLGGHLVSINSQSENDFIVEKFKDNSGLTVVRNDGLPNYHFTYIGLYDDANGNFFWTDGSTVNWTNWAPTNPYDNGTGQGSWASQITGIELDNYWAPSYAGKWINGGANNHSGIAEIPLSYFSISDLTIREGNSGNITISRTGGTNSAQNITLTSNNGTANAGSDYTAINTSISFAAGETSKTFSVSTTDDSSSESNETFTLTITASNSDTVPAQITDGNATITIDEAARVTGPSGSAGDSSSSKSINENTTAVHTFSANETVTWSLNGGADASKFAINTATGALTFSSAPNYESPTDSDSGNNYVVVVRATDSPAILLIKQSLSQWPMLMK